MIVRLTTFGRIEAEQALWGDAELLRRFRSNVVVSGNRHDIQAPYVLWALIRDRLIARAYKKSGQKHTEITSRMVVALRQVTRATNRHETHPGFQGVAMLGRQFEYLYGWALPEPDMFGRMWSPMPVAGEFTILGPQWSAYDGDVITLWSPNGLHHPPDDFTSEQVHLDIWHKRD